MNKQLALALLGDILRHGATSLGVFLVGNKILNGDQIGQFNDLFVGIGMALFGVGWQFWRTYGHAMVNDLVVILKSKLDAAAAKAQPSK